MQTAPTPPGGYIEGFPSAIPATNTLPNGIPSGDLDAARLAYRLTVESWKLLETCQDFADAAFMKAHIKAAGLRVPHKLEPASTNRLRRLLNRADVSPETTFETLGVNLKGYLTLNPGLPLWAALAWILEATGKFTEQAFGLLEGDGN